MHIVTMRSEKRSPDRVTKSRTIQVRRETYPKLRGIASRRRWTLTETVDALADAFLEREEKPNNKDHVLAPAGSA